MIEFLKRIFSEREPSRYLGRFRVRDTTPVYTEVSTEYTIAGAPAAKGQTVNRVSLKTVAAGLSTSGTAQSGATPITAVFNEFTTVGSSGGASLLPAAKAGLGPIYVDNIGGSNSMNVFAAGTDTINGGSQGGSFAVANAKRAIFYCVVAGNWKTILTA